MWDCESPCVPFLGPWVGLSGIATHSSAMYCNTERQSSAAMGRFVKSMRLTESYLRNLAGIGSIVDGHR